MKTLIALLNENTGVSDWKINTHCQESYELFFVKGKLETVRCTDTRDTEVTVYADHEEFRGEARFFVYPSTAESQIAEKIREAVNSALLIKNKPYSIPCQNPPAEDQTRYTVESNFSRFSPADLAAKIANIVFDANTTEHGALNSVEVFINKHTDSLINSGGLNKTQVRYDAMVEAIPTYNGEKESVELYEQYNFSSLNEDALFREIQGKMEEVQARYEAEKPDYDINCPVLLHSQELSDLFRNIVYDLNYASVYSKSNLFSRGDAIQKNPTGDLLGITMAGSVPGSVRSSAFDGDGLVLTEVRLVEEGKAVNYFGSNRFGQYLGEIPTGNLPCMKVDTGSLNRERLSGSTHLEVVSMSGLQVDFYTDYIGGEIRLARYHKDGVTVPLTGISISGKLSEVLNSIRLSDHTEIRDGYAGPDAALVTGMSIF